MHYLSIWAALLRGIKGAGRKTGNSRKNKQRKKEMEGEIKRRKSVELMEKKKGKSVSVSSRSIFKMLTTCLMTAPLLGGRSEMIARGKKLFKRCRLFCKGPG